MALRLQLAPQAVDTLAHRAAPVRERPPHEGGGGLSMVPASPPAARPAPEVSEQVLHSGFRARYWLDPSRGLLNLLDLKAPAGTASRP